MLAKINSIKSYRSYTVIELAELLGKHPKTIRNWIKAGLPVEDSKRPLLIIGMAAKVYLKKKRKEAMQKLQLHELYCFKCKEEKEPDLDTVFFEKMAGGMVQMTGECSDPECECEMNKYVSMRDLNHIWLALEGKLPIPEKHLILIGKAPLNYPFK